MSTGSLPVLVKNAKQLAPGMAAFASSFSANLGLLKKYKDRQYAAAPQEHRDVAEAWDTDYWKRGWCQKKNMWVDKDLDTEMTRKDLAQLMQFKMDSWRVAHWMAPTALTGGYGLVAMPFWLANDTWQPSTMPQTPEALAEWRAAQDLQRYKYCPAAVTTFRWWFEHHAAVPDSYAVGWEELVNERNDVRKNVTEVAKISKMYSGYQTFEWIRRQQCRIIGRAMGLPTFPMWSKICTQTRIKDFWELAWNEDMMVLKNGLLEKMDDAELYDYAWRRYLAPYDKELTREQLLERINDYHVVLGGDKFVESGEAANIFVLTAYCFSHYYEPAYLEGDISELDGNDFENMAQWGKDAYLQRLEFENGPLRDQVEAHSQKKIAEREAKLKALETA